MISSLGNIERNSNAVSDGKLDTMFDEKTFIMRQDTLQREKILLCICV